MPKPTKTNWQRLKRKTIYENPWVTLYEDDVLTPSQEKGIYSIISFKNKAAAAIPIDSEGFTWLVGQFRYPLNRYSWELPMGGSDNYEDVLLGAQRELREETGITAKTWAEILRFDTIVSIGKEEGVVYLAQDLSFGELETEDSEELQLRRVHIDEAISMAIDGQITDSITLAGLFKLATCKEKFGL